MKIKHHVAAFFLVMYFSTSLRADVRSELQALREMNSQLDRTCAYTLDSARDMTSNAVLYGGLGGILTGGVMTLVSIPLMTEAHRRHQAVAECERSMQRIDEAVLFIHAIYNLGLGVKGTYTEKARAILSSLLKGRVVSKDNMRIFIQRIQEHERAGMRNLVGNNLPETRKNPVQFKKWLGMHPISVFYVVAPDYVGLIIDYIVNNILPDFEKDAIPLVSDSVYSVPPSAPSKEEMQ